MNKSCSARAFASFLILAAALLFPAGPLPAQERSGAAARPDPGQVFAELIRPYRSLNDYTVKIRVKVAMPEIRIREFTATLYFKKPDKFHVETRRFAPIPRASGVFDPFQFDPEKNRILFMQTESLAGARADLYRLEPLDPKSPIRAFQVWVGGSPARILQVESLSLRGTRALVKVSHQSVEEQGRKWLLPAQVQVHITFPEAARAPDGLTTRDNPISGGMRQLDEMTGEGDITIDYSDWRVNTGLDDSLFKQ